MRILDGKIEDLQLSFLKMCALVEESLGKSLKALGHHQLDLVEDVIQLDRRIDELEMLVEEKCLRIIATQQPVAADLRRFSSVLKIITDLERIGDYSVNIAKIVPQLRERLPQESIDPLMQMGEKTLSIIRKSIDAWVHEDVAAAQEAGRMDDVVDDIYRKLYTEQLQGMSGDSESLKETMHVLFIGRYLERIADHGTNICERVVFMVNGNREHY